MNKRLLIVIVIAVVVLLICAIVGVGVVVLNVGSLMATPTPTITPTPVRTATPRATATPIPPTATATPTAIPTSANPADALSKMFTGWAGVKSFRVKTTVTTLSGTPAPQEFTIEVVTPDRFHMIGKSLEAIKIGTTIYMKIGNNWQKVTVAQSIDFSFGDVKKLQAELGSSTEIKSVGMEALDNTPTLVYQYTTTIKTPIATTTTSKVWVAVTDGLPRKIESTAKNGTKTVAVFSDYNTAITIDAPIK